MPSQAKTEAKVVKGAKAAKAVAKRKAPARAPDRKASAAGATLVVVESPAKAKTIKKYLGRAFDVKASVGHVKDLPKSKMGVDIEQGFTPAYDVIKGKAKVLSDIKRAAHKADRVFLATDPDREGEAIAWHIAEEIGDGDGKVRRVLFNEITKNAIQKAIAEPLDLDRKLLVDEAARAREDGQEAVSERQPLVRAQVPAGDECAIEVDELRLRHGIDRGDGEGKVRVGLAADETPRQKLSRAAERVAPRAGREALEVRAGLRVEGPGGLALGCSREARAGSRERPPRSDLAEDAVRLAEDETVTARVVDVERRVRIPGEAAVR